VLSDAVAAYLSVGIESSRHFDSDEACMASCELLLEIQQVMFDCEQALKERAITPGGGSTEQELQDAILVVENLRSLSEKLHALHSSRFSNDQNNDGVTNKVTRLRQLADGLKLTGQEVLAVAFIAMRNSGKLGSEAYERRGVLRNMSLFARIGGRQLMSFVSPNRAHLKQGVFEIDDEFSPGGFESAIYRMPREVIKALYGGTLATSEVNTLDGTALGGILEKVRGQVQ
jgi:hypothetical protein